MSLDVQSSEWVGENDYAEVDDHDHDDGDGDHDDKEGTRPCRAAMGRPRA